MSLEKYHAMIGLRIEHVRRLRGLTTTELAQKIDISQAQISRLENAKQGFRSATLMKIAEALQVPVHTFMLPETCETKDENGKVNVEALIALAKALENPKNVEGIIRGIA